MAEVIAATAIRVGGMTVSLPQPARHFHVLKSLRETFGDEFGDAAPENQGFVTSFGRYVGRREAKRIAVEAGQVADGGQAELFSEDVW